MKQLRTWAFFGLGLAVSTAGLCGDRLLATGGVMQLDAYMLFGRAPICRLARALLQEGYIDCIASDNHGDGRNLLAARRWLEELGAAEQARVLTETNPARLLAGERLLPVDPVPEANEGVLSRLRDLITGRP